MLISCPVPGKDKSARICRAFMDGAPRDAEGYVFFGVNEANAEQWRIAKASGLPWFYIDNSFFDVTRGQRFRVARNRVQVNARELTSDGRRFDALGLEIKPWTVARSGYWLVIEQSQSFMRTVADAPDWLSRTLYDLSSPAGAPVRVRAWNRDKHAQMRTLDADLAGAKCLVTHTSAAAVQAVLQGVPAYVDRMHALAQMVCGLGGYTDRDQRRRFLSVLADHEFTLDELRAGAAWHRLHHPELHR